MASAPSPRVELAPGTGLVGAVFKATDRDVPVYAFKGIPYAQPPVGELRFQPPKPAELWTGDRQATEYGKWMFRLSFRLNDNALFDKYAIGGDVILPKI